MRGSGAGAAGMAFTDALVDQADVSVVMVDRRHGVGGHWLDAYPFVRLHQASSFYGVASTLLGYDRIQAGRPRSRPARAGERAGDLRVLRPGAARAPARVRPGFLLSQLRLPRRGSVRLARVRAGAIEVRGRRRVVDARYLSPMIPATTPAPFGVADGVHAVTVNDLVNLGGAPSQYVIAGSGEDRQRRLRLAARQRRRSRRHRAGYVPATRGCSTAPWSSRTRSCSSVRRPTSWRQRPRPDLQSTCPSCIEDAGVDAADRSVRDCHDGQDSDARSVGARPAAHDRARRPTRPHPARGARPVGARRRRCRRRRDAVVVHCAAAGLQYPPLLPIWGHEAITLQPIRPPSPASVPRWRVTSRRRSRTTPRRTACAHRRRSPTHRPTGRGSRCSALGRRSPRIPTSGTGSTR